MPVYIFWPTARPFVKIGHAENIWRRLGETQTYSPDHIKVLSIIEGGESLERELHRRFERYRVRGEWFKLSPEIKKFTRGFPPPPFQQHTRYVPPADKVLSRLKRLRSTASKTISIFMISVGLRNHLLHLAGTYSIATGRSFATISRLAYGRHGFLSDYEAGKISISIDKYDEILEWFKQNWPHGIPRPRAPTITWHQPSRVRAPRSASHVS